MFPLEVTDIQKKQIIGTVISQKDTVFGLSSGDKIRSGAGATGVTNLSFKALGPTWLLKHLSPISKPAKHAGV